MRKFCYLLLIALSLSTSAAAWDRIPLAVGIIESMPIGHGHGKSPMRPPVVYIEDHTLSFVVDHPDYELTIKDEDGEVVYSTFVAEGTTTIVLPSTLSGDYEIRFVDDTYYYYGYIEL